jgi:hypothetical protein
VPGGVVLATARMGLVHCVLQGRRLTRAIVARLAGRSDARSPCCRCVRLGAAVCQGSPLPRLQQVRREPGQAAGLRSGVISASAAGSGRGAACVVPDEPIRLRAFTLSAEAHHVAASVLLKAGDPGLGWLAADRSMQAARASHDARALLQCGRHERAYLALRAAEQIAPEEITGRSAVHRIIVDLMTSAPPSIQRQGADFGRMIGMTQ